MLHEVLGKRWHLHSDFSFGTPPVTRQAWAPTPAAELGVTQQQTLEISLRCKFLN